MKPRSPPPTPPNRWRPTRLKRHQVGVDTDHPEPGLVLAGRPFHAVYATSALGALVIPVASEVAGRVIRVNVHNNQTVKAGDVLFEVDPAPFKIAVDRARADLKQHAGN